MTDLDTWNHLVTARERALSAAASRAKAENADMVVYRLPKEPASCYVQHASLALPEGAELLDTVGAPSAYDRQLAADRERTAQRLFEMDLYTR